jgi:type IV secretory pathway protease TraF
VSKKGIFVTEEDIGTYTIKAVDDPRTLNKIVYIRPPANILSHNELVSLWEKKVGKIFQRVYIPEDEVLKKIEGTTQKHVQNPCCNPHFSLSNFTRFTFIMF